MKRTLQALLIVLLILGMATASMAGSYTAHGYFYKPSYNEKGPAAYALYNAALNALDTFLYSLSSVATLVSNWAIEDQIVTLIPVTPTYVDNNTFTLPGAGDYTSRFTTGAVVQAQVAAGMVFSTVASSSYAAPTTTVNINDTVLTNPITRVYVVATRDGLWPNGPGYVVARDYGTDRAALVAADAVAAGANKELRITYPFPIDANVTLSAPKVTCTPEAILPISTTKILTVNGSFSAGLYQTFACTGTGKVVFGDNSIKEAFPQWWGAVGNGSTDDLIPIQAAVTAAKRVFFPPSTYKITACINLPQYHEITGAGNSIIYSVPASAVADGAQAIYAASDTKITNLWLKGNYTALPWNAGTYLPGWHCGVVAVHASSRIHITDCEISNFGYNGIYLSNSSYCIVSRNRIHDCINEGILLYTPDTTGQNNVVSNNIVYNCLSWGIDTNCDLTVIQGNSVFNCGDATSPITASDGGGIVVSGANGCSVTGNVINYSAWNGIRINDADYPSVVGNVIGDIGTAAVDFDARGISLATITNGVANGNTINRVKSSGATTNASGIYINDFINLTVTGNTISTVTGGKGWGIVCTGPSAAQEINLIVNNNNIAGATNALAPAIHDGSTYIIMSSNNIAGNTNAVDATYLPYTITWTVGQAPILRNNVGYNPIGSLSTLTVNPAMPISGGLVRNDMGCTVEIYIKGTLDNIYKFHLPAGPAVDIGIIVGTVTLEPGEYIQPVYSGATPTWQWFGK